MAKMTIDKRIKDETGNVYGDLTVISIAETDHPNAYWRVRCSCGTEKLVGGSNLRRGAVKSCGCKKNKMVAEGHTIHGMEGTRLYNIWGQMKQRCKQTTYRDYPRYGGRGITLCDEWHDFVPFMEWALANGYQDDLSIDRKENDGNYEPSNCRWATRVQQQNNTRRNRWITIGDETKTTSQWARHIGLDVHVINNRLKLGKTGTDLIAPKKVIRRKQK